MSTGSPEKEGKNSRRKSKKTLRAYELALYPNPGKAEETRYAMWWYQHLTLEYVQALYEQPPGFFLSTASKGKLANQAQKRARDMLRAGRAAEKQTGLPFGCPQSAPFMCEGIIQEAKGTVFAYWVKIPLGPWLPAKTHKALKKALRKGGRLRRMCEVRQGKKGGLVVRCFVEFAKSEAQDTGRYLGCDVGVNAGVARSDGYVGQSLGPVMAEAQRKRSERQRQGHRKTSVRSAVKQVLNREARRVVTLAKLGGKTLVLESPKALKNLNSSFTNWGTYMLMLLNVRCPICCMSIEFRAGLVSSTKKINPPKIPVTRRINSLANPNW